MQLFRDQTLPSRKLRQIGIFVVFLAFVGCTDTGPEIVGEDGGGAPTDDLERAVFMIPDEFGEPAEPGKLVSFGRVNGRAVSGDIVYPDWLLKAPEDVESIDADAGDGERTVHQGLHVTSEGNRLWPEGRVPYEIAPGFPNKERVTEAIAHWNDETPIELVHRDGEQGYVTFTHEEENGEPVDGCRAHVGRTGRQQFVWLSDRCNTGSAIHEIGHAVGLYHEHNRNDRDEYVDILWENIKEGDQYKAAFEQDGQTDVGPYDIQSVMHYSSHAFSKNGEPTIVRASDGATFDRNRDGLTDADTGGVRETYSDGSEGSGSSGGSADCSETARLAGANRFRTAVEISKESYPAGTDEAVLVEGSDRNPDALASGPLAVSRSAPILLSGQDTVPDVTMTELRRLGVQTVHIVGGPNAVSGNVGTELEQEGMSVRRIAGSSRFETAAKLAREVGDSSGFAYVAAGADDRLADALAASGPAGAMGAPILLVTRDEIPEATQRVLDDFDIDRTVVLGGSVSISDRVKRQLPNAERVAGGNRFETAVAVAEDAIDRGGGPPQRINLARGDKMPDALAAGASQNLVLLSPSDSLPDSIQSFLARHGPKVDLLGGPAALSENLEAEVCDVLTDESGTEQGDGDSEMPSNQPPLIFEVIWAGETDLDLQVETPSGEVLGPSNPSTKLGTYVECDDCDNDGTHFEAVWFSPAAESPTGEYEFWATNHDETEAVEADFLVKLREQILHLPSFSDPIAPSKDSPRFRFEVEPGMFGGDSSEETERSPGGDGLPQGWPEQFEFAPHNPVVLPTKSSLIQGGDNIYAPDVHHRRGGYVMFYGGQGKPGEAGVDQIFAATSDDGRAWRKYPSGDRPEPVLAVGSSNHVNDPSVVRHEGKWWMYYTDAATGIDDKIGLAKATNAASFEKVSTDVLKPGPPGSWDAGKVGRPSVLYENGTYKMWYDGQDGGTRQVGYAVSDDGVHFTKHPDNPILQRAGAVDVERVGDTYVMVFEARRGTHWATSPDGVDWTKRGLLLERSGKEFDAYGHPTPHLQVHDGELEAIWFGGASASSWASNRIGVAYPDGELVNAGGCTACTANTRTCAEQCQANGVGATGQCAAPGSTSAGSCCHCSASPCGSCLSEGSNCNDACIETGKLGGRCGHPGSTDPGKCCVCYD